MARVYLYHVMPDPDGFGWVVLAEGFIARSLPYGTRDKAIEMSEILVQEHPGSAIILDAYPPVLSPAEIEHHQSA